MSMSGSSRNTSIGILLLLAAAVAFALIAKDLSNEEVQQWAARQKKIFQELQAVHAGFKNAEILHYAYVVSGAPEQLKEFNDCVKQLDSDLEALTLEDENRFRPLQSKVKGALEQFKLTTVVRKDQNLENARALMMTSREMRETRDVARQIEDAEAFEVNLIQMRLQSYTSIFDARLLVLTFSVLVAMSYFVISRMRQPALTAAEESNRKLRAELDVALAQLDRLANVDFLTEVLNSHGLERVLFVEQSRTGRIGGHMVALLGNCDNLRRVNEGLGHSVGDVVLKEVAKRISSVLRPTDHIARIGGDEFLVLLPDTQIAYAMRVAERIRISVSETAFSGAAEVLNITISIGVAAVPDNIASLEQVISAGRAALKRSKQAGKNKVSMAREGPGEEEIPAARDIVEVLCDGTDFRTVFQPVMNLTTDQVSGYEIFTRGPEGLFESPADFFRVCVENNILTTVDLQCLKTCLATISSITEDLRFYINIFPSTLLDTPVQNLIAMFPTERGGKQFCLEISEQHFIGDPGYLKDHVNAFKQAGILVAIDDVGFGRNSLESLILLEPDLVKVDRKYVTGVANEPAKSRLLKRVVNVARSLGAEVVAEGIENDEDLPILKEIGIHYGQGYYWGGLLDTVPVSAAGSHAAI